MALPPNASERPLDERGNFTKAWLAYFRALGVSGTDAAINAALAELRGRIEALEQRGEGQIQGLASVQVRGALVDGLVQIALWGDSNEPAPTYYYGTNADGVKGWYSRAFLGLSDGPSDYTGQAGKVVAVNAAEDGVEFIAQEMSGNLDGGHADTNYGGTTAIDAGGA